MKSRQNGFSAVEIVLVLIIVGLVGFIGWYVWNANMNHEDTSNKTQTSGEVSQKPAANANNSQSAESSAGYFVLTEYNVRIPLTEVTKALVPGKAADSQDPNAKTVSIKAPELDAKWTCEPNPSDGNSKGILGNISVTKTPPRVGPGEPAATKKVGEYTYGLEPGGSNCTTDAAYKKLLDEFKQNFDKMEAVKQ